jgi:hypothetical protein
MAQTFQALLTGDQLKWNPSRPAKLPQDKPILVNVTVVDDPVSEAPAGAAMSAALEQLARTAPLADVDDPVEWQRALRSDRSLPGRD